MQGSEWTVDNCQYRNGERPIAVYFIKESTDYKPIVTVTENGKQRWHCSNGYFFVESLYPSKWDLIPLPKKEWWSKPEHVNRSARYLNVNGSADGEDNCIIYGLDNSGIVVGNTKLNHHNGFKIITWERLTLPIYRWSDSPFGPWKECLVENQQ